MIANEQRNQGNTGSCVERIPFPEPTTASPQGLLSGTSQPLPRGAIDGFGDLGIWVRPAAMLAWILDEIEAVGHDRREPAGRMGEPTLTKERAMAGLLVFACAREMFDSEEVARACRTDPILRQLCGGAAPFADELQTFRRRNRPLLEGVLTQRLGPGSLLLPGVMENHLRRFAVERFNLARHMDHWSD
jgi:hypothetical protein